MATSNSAFAFAHGAAASAPGSPAAPPAVAAEKTGVALGEPRSMADLVNMLGLDSMAYADAKKKLLADFNEAYVSALLRAASGNMSEAARRSGLDRSNFRRLVRTTTGDGADGAAAGPGDKAPGSKS
jgi:DNA-binding NtrC family response regulator